MYEFILMEISIKKQVKNSDYTRDLENMMPLLSPLPHFILKSLTISNYQRVVSFTQLCNSGNCCSNNIIIDFNTIHLICLSTDMGVNWQEIDENITGYCTYNPRFATFSNKNQ